jgi:hypothetical protein
LRKQLELANIGSEEEGSRFECSNPRVEKQTRDD